MPRRNVDWRALLDRMNTNAQAVMTGVYSFREAVVALDESLESGSLVTGQSEMTMVGNPNTENEGESSMPTVETINVQLPENVRTQVFDSLNARNTLMTNLDLEHWAETLETIRGHLGEMQAEVTRGSFRVENAINSTHPLLGRVRLDTLLLEEAREVVRIASDDKFILDILDDPITPDRPSKYAMRPVHPLDSEGFKAYSGNQAYGISWQENTPHLNMNDIKEGMQSYLDYRDGRRRYIRRAMQTRMLSGNIVPVLAPTLDDAQKKKRNDNLYNFLEKVKKNAKPDKSPFQKIAILPHKTLSSRRWGIEIEAVDIYDIPTPSNWILHGDGSLRTEPRGEQIDPDVDHEGDCAIYEDDDADCTCGAMDDNVFTEVNAGLPVDRPALAGEWNSPILHSFHSRGLQHLCDSLDGRYSNSSAGVHVHVEASDLTPDEAVQLSMIYTALEPLFEREYFRTERNYCKSVDLNQMIQRLETAKQNKGKKATAMSFGSRYFTVNLAALNTHGTVEFRAMGPVYKYNHLTRWAHFCRELVNIAKAHVPQKAWSRVSTFEDLIVLFSKYGKETPTPKWAKDGEIDFDPIVAALGTENRLLPNARPSNAYTRSGNGTAPVELFDDYTRQLAVTGSMAQITLRGQY